MSADPKNIPVFILAGGLGTRLSEETHVKPKPMIEIGEIPILLHIMRWYYAAGFNDFVICAGYKSWEIKKFFLNYKYRCNHLEIDHRKELQRDAEILESPLTQEKWRVRVIDTGLDCMTGGRVARALDYVMSTGQDFSNFALTYGDGVSDVPLLKELGFHSQHGKIGTVLGVKPSARFGELDLDAQNCVTSFQEKPQAKQGYINGGFFFFKKEFRKYLSDEADCILERKPLAGLADDRQLVMYGYDGFWRPMDSLRDKTDLQTLWESGKAPWNPR